MPRFKPLHITRRFLEAVIAKVHPMPQDMPVAPGWVWQGDGAERNLTVAGYRILRLLNGEDTQELDLEGDFLKNMRTVCELRRRLRNDCDEAVQHALTQAMIACAEAQTVMVHLAAEQVRHEETKAALEDARTRLTDFEDDFRRTLSEDCAPDERHCSCVPHLRQALRDAHRDGQLAAAERATPIVNDIATQRDMAVREVKRLRDEIEELRLTLAAEQGKPEGAPSEGWHNVAADMHDTYWQKATDRGVWAVTPTSRMERLTMAQGQHRRAALVGPDGLVCTVYAMTDRAVMISADAATVRS